jgi:protein-tyrosine phosphatase
MCRRLRSRIGLFRGETLSDTHRRERRVVLDGAQNFRDLGGHPTIDGRRVRWGAVYRSDHLSRLTDADHRVLERLDLELVCDLRAPHERAERPNRLPSMGPLRVLNIAVEVQAGTELEALLVAGERDKNRLRRVVAGGYREFVHTHRSAWSELFRALLDERSGATVIHCSAGQDRTGFATALLLLAIGVSRDVVVEDYLLTEVYRPGEAAVDDVEAKDSPFPTSLVVDVLRPRSALLEASFEAMESGYDSIQGYLSAIGVDERARELLRERLLV